MQTDVYKNQTKLKATQTTGCKWRHYAVYSAFESTLISSIVSYRIV